MPELPEVETVVRDLLAARLVGRIITGAEIRWPRILDGMPVKMFRKRIAGLRITGIRRRAKYIVISLSGKHTLLIHLRMTGQLSLSTSPHPADRHIHVTLTLDDGRYLMYRDPRKFGRWTLIHGDPDRLHRLGPEPLDKSFTPDVFAEKLTLRRGMLKPLLLNQAFIAGLGNIYADEALWAAGLHPQRRAESLSPADRRRLYQSIRLVLRRGVAAMGTTLGRASTNFYSVGGRRGRNQDGLKVFRRTGEPCPRCGAAIQRLIVSQRSSHICPACQRIPATQRNG